jgi:hypothetical protein
MTATVYGLKIDLDEGRQVFVGAMADTEDRFVQFTARNGRVRRMRLSIEGAQALRELLPPAPRPLIAEDATLTTSGQRFEWRVLDTTES